MQDMLGLACMVYFIHVCIYIVNDVKFTLYGACAVNRGTLPETNEIVTHICSCHNFFSLSSVQILLIPACCLLCVL